MVFVRPSLPGGWPRSDPPQMIGWADSRYKRNGIDFSDLRRAGATGRPLGAPDFVSGLENLLGRKIARRAPGRRSRTKSPAGNQLRLM